MLQPMEVEKTNSSHVNDTVNLHIFKDLVFDFRICDILKTSFDSLQKIYILSHNRFALFLILK